MDLRIIFMEPDFVPKRKKPTVESCFPESEIAGLSSSFEGSS
jgi:hypothetical protein